MKLALLITSFMFLYSCTPTSTVTGDVSTGNINAAAPYTWSVSAFPRDLKISTTFDVDEKANIVAMSTQWETSLEDKKNFFNNNTTTAEKSAPGMSLESFKDSVSAVYKITDWPDDPFDDDKYLPSSALAVTQIFGRRFNIGDSDEFVRIEHADILVNYDDHTFRTSSADPTGDYDLQTVLAHEMGHYLGLSHKTNGENSIMRPTIGTGTVARAPTSLDVLDVADKYNISLGSGGSSAISTKPLFDRYQAKPGDAGAPVKMLIELHADGECVHKENGVVTERHSTRK